MTDLEKIFQNTSIKCLTCFKADPKTICTAEGCNVRLACSDCTKGHIHRDNLMKWSTFCDLNSKNFNANTPPEEEKFRRNLNFAVDEAKELYHKLFKSQKHYKSWKNKIIEEEQPNNEANLRQNLAKIVFGLPEGPIDNLSFEKIYQFIKNDPARIYERSLSERMKSYQEWNKYLEIGLEFIDKFSKVAEQICFHDKKTKDCPKRISYYLDSFLSRFANKNKIPIIIEEEPQTSVEEQNWLQNFQSILDSQKHSKFDVEIDMLDELWQRAKNLGSIKEVDHFRQLKEMKQNAEELKVWVEKLEERKREFEKEVNELLGKPKKVHPDKYEQEGMPDYAKIKQSLLELNKRKIPQSEFDLKVEAIKKLGLKLWQDFKVTFKEEIQRPPVEVNKTSYISLQKRIASKAKLVIHQEICQEELDLFLQGKIIYDELSNFNAYQNNDLKDFDLKCYFETGRSFERFCSLENARELLTKVEKSTIQFSDNVTSPLIFQVKKAVILSGKIQLVQNDPQSKKNWADFIIDAQDVKLKFPELSDLRKPYLENCKVGTLFKSYPSPNK